MANDPEYYGPGVPGDNLDAGPAPDMVDFLLV